LYSSISVMFGINAFRNPLRPATFVGSPNIVWVFGSVHSVILALASLGLLGGMTSTASPSSDRPNRKKRAAQQDDVERRVQPKRNAKKTTSYRDLDDHVIYKRTRPIDSSDTGEEDTVRKRMREDGDDVEEYDVDEDELESGEFNSHILLMSFSPNTGPNPPHGRKRRSSSPR